MANNSNNDVLGQLLKVGKSLLDQYQEQQEKQKENLKPEPGSPPMKNLDLTDRELTSLRMMVTHYERTTIVLTPTDKAVLVKVKNL